MKISEETKLSEAGPDGYCDYHRQKAEGEKMRNRMIKKIVNLKSQLQAGRMPHCPRCEAKMEDKEAEK